MIGLSRALCVLDLEAEGWEGKSHGADEKRKSAIMEASKRLCCSYHTVEKDFYKYERVITCLEAPIFATCATFLLPYLSRLLIYGSFFWKELLVCSICSL